MPFEIPNDPGRDIPSMSGIGGQPFDAGGINGLVATLWAAYEDSVRVRLDDMRAAGHRTAEFKDAIRRAPATDFFKFCQDYLAENRPVQTFAADSNVGFMLSNNVRAVLSPPLEGEFRGYGGYMQDAGDVGITRGSGQPGLGGVVGGDSGLKII